MEKNVNNWFIEALFLISTNLICTKKNKNYELS
jgi:hypothetical protein